MYHDSSTGVFPLKETISTINPTTNAPRASHDSVLDTGITSSKPRTAIIGSTKIVPIMPWNLECRALSLKEAIKHPPSPRLMDDIPKKQKTKHAHAQSDRIESILY